MSSNKQIMYFSTSDIIIYGTKNNKTIYKAQNFISSEALLISYGGKLKGSIAVVVEQHPNKKNFGIIIEVLGLMISSNLYKILRHIYNINIKKTKIEIIEINLCNYISEDIFSIDPDETVDIDDAISWKELEEYYKIIIYIARPTAFIQENELVNISKYSFSTLYKSPGNINLLSDDITFNSSFLENKIKPAFAIEFLIDKITYKITNIKNFICNIINSHKRSYDNCFELSTIKLFFELSKKISKNYEFIINNSHNLISFWMIQTNLYIGNLCMEKKLNIPYRVIKIENLSEDIIKELNNIKDQDIRQIFYEKKSLCSVYIYSDNINYHNKLKLFNYTHFTSPIRRIIDTLIQWSIIHNIKFNELLDKYNCNLEIINKNAKSTKQYHRDIELLNAVNITMNTPFDINGYIYKKGLENYWTIYFKTLGFQKIKMWDKKFSYFITEDIKKKIENIKIGDKSNFRIFNRNGFLPREKIFIEPIELIL